MNLKKNTLQLIFANSIQLLFGLFQVVFFSRLLEYKHDFGLLQQITLISSLLVASAGALPNSINYFFGLYEPDHDKAGQLVKRFFYNNCFLAVIISVLFLLFHRPLATIFSNQLLSEEITWIIVLIFLRLTNLIYQNVCLIKGRLRQLILVHFLQLLLLSIVFLFRDQAGHISLILLLYVLVFAELIKTIPLIIITWPHLGLTSSFFQDIKLTMQEWKYVLYLLLNGVLIAVSTQADRLIVASLSNPETYSDYSLGTFANPLIGVVLASLTSTFIPVLSGLYARKDVKGILDVWKKTSRAGMVLVLPLVIFTIIFGNDVVVFLFSSKYVSAGLLFQLFNCKYLFIFIVFTITMNAIGLERYTVINSAINLVTGVCLVILGLKMYGAIGAVSGSIISIYLGYFFPVMLINRKLDCSFSDYFPVKSFFIALSVTCLAGILLFLIKKIFSFSPYIIIFIAAPLYYITCFMLLNRFVVEIISIGKLRKQLFR